MNKKPIILLVFLLVFVSLIPSVFATAGDLIAYINYDNQTLGNVPDNLLEAATPTNPCTTASAVVTQEGTKKYMAWNDSTACRYDINTTITSGSSCWNLEWNQTTANGGGADNEIDFGDHVSRLGWTIYGQGYNTAFNFYDTTEGTFTGSTPTAGWHNITFCMDLNTDTGHIFVDGVRSTDSGWDARTSGRDIDIITFGNPEFNYNAIRSICAWVGNYSDRPTVCNTGTGGAGGTNDQINISTDVKPLTNTQFNQNNINFNITGINASVNFNCSFILNGTINRTQNYTAGTGLNANFSITIPEGDYTFSFNCSANQTTDSTSTNTFYVDTTAPAITTNYANHTVIYGDRFLSGQFNFTDNIILYSYNISINGLMIANATNVGGTLYMYNLSYNVSNLTGLNSLTVTTADGHTAIEIGTISWTNGMFNDYLRYTLDDKGAYIRTELKDSSIFDDWTTTKLTDRYTQTLKPANPSDTVVLVEKSNIPIEIIYKEGYYGGAWLVIGKYWKDYVLTGEDAAKVSFKRNSAYEVEVTITGIKNTEELKFNSIGELNIYTVYYDFYVGNYSTSYVTPVLENSNTNLNLSFSRYNYTTDISASLNWNGTIYTANKSAGIDDINFTVALVMPSVEANANIVFNWSYNVTSAINYSNITANQQQAILNFGLDNCSSYTIHTLNFTQAHETYLTKLEGDLSIDLTLFIGTTNQSKGYNFTNVNNASLCLSNSTFSIYMDGYIKWKAAGFTHRYYLNNVTLSNVTSVINMYNYNETTGYETLELVVKDANNDYYPNVLVYMQRYYPAEQLWRTVQVDKSEDFGKTFFHVIEQAEDYKFIFVKDNQTLKTSNQMKIYCPVSEDCLLTFIMPAVSEEVSSLEGLNYNYTWDNSTGMINFSWVDTTGLTKTIEFNVIKRDMANDVIICKQAFTTVSGSTTCNVSAYTGTFELTAFRTASPERPFLFAVISRGVGKLFDKLDSTDSVLLAFFIFVTIVLMGLWSGAAAIGAAIFALIIIYFLGLTSWIVLTFIIAAGLIGLILAAIIRT